MNRWLVQRSNAGSRGLVAEWVFDSFTEAAEFAATEQRFCDEYHTRLRHVFTVVEAQP